MVETIRLAMTPQDITRIRFADVLAGVEEALRRGDFIDPERLGVMGGSYGGFLTSWTVGHTQRFKAACSERAANNPIPSLVPVILATPSRRPKAAIFPGRTRSGILTMHR